MIIFLITNARKTLISLKCPGHLGALPVIGNANYFILMK